MRSLGAEGTKRGLTTTLPAALGKLQSTGEIRRISTNGRLDHQRYRYALWRPNPLGRLKPKQPQYALLSSLDGITHLRRDIQTLLAAADFERKLFVEKGYQAAGQLSDLPSHGIFDRGRLIGLWEYDVTNRSIAWATFASKDKALLEAVKRCENYVRDELGDARSFSLDSPKSRVPRIEALRKSS